MSTAKTTIYGIPNCNTVQKVLSFYDQHRIPYTFVNFKSHPPTETQLSAWDKRFGGQLVNRKGPTFRKIKEAYESASTVDQKRKLLIEHSSAIKRPIVESNGAILFHGYDEEALNTLVKVSIASL